MDRFTGRRLLPSPCAVAASASTGGKIYVIGGTSGHPTLCPGAVYYKSLWVFDPQGGVAPEMLSVLREGADTVRFVWLGEAGRRYAVEATVKATRQTWPRLNLTTGGTILATNRVVEANATLPPGDPARFFRIVEVE